MQKLLILSVIFLQQFLQAQSEYPYCFRFTWIGPHPDKRNIGSLTCEGLREDLTTVPCRRPLVATHNDTTPDTLDLWRRTKDTPNQFGCPMTPGESCIKYTYTYNKGVQNITYMCAKVNATSGCYRQRYISGLEVEVCVCQSEEGLIPCNYAGGKHQISAKLLTVSVMLSSLFWTLRQFG